MIWLVVRPVWESVRAVAQIIRERPPTGVVERRRRRRRRRRRQRRTAKGSDTQ